MNKKTKYAINGAVFVGLGNALINTFEQLDNPNRAFSWKDFFKAFGNGALLGGGIGLTAGVIVDYNNKLEAPLKTDVLLYSIIDKVKLKKSNDKYKRLCAEADLLVELLKERFGNKLSGEPMKLGSTEKGTALRDSFDIDICLPFRRNSFSTIEDMYYDVFYFLEDSVGKFSIARVRNQKKSIGVFVTVFGEEMKIDIVPYRIAIKGKNQTKGYLFVNEKKFLTNHSTYTKTDIHTLKSVKLTKTQQNIIILLKNWKSKNELPISSYLLEVLILEAYAYNKHSIPKKFTEKVIMVITFIAKNLRQLTISGIENSNNILTNISEDKKLSIINACNNVIEEYSYQPNTVIKTLSI